MLIQDMAANDPFVNAKSENALGRVGRKPQPLREDRGTHIWTKSGNCGANRWVKDAVPFLSSVAPSLIHASLECGRFIAKHLWFSLV